MHGSLRDAARTLERVAEDYTKDGGYEQLVAEEIEHYCEIEVTESLTEGGLHNSRAWGFSYNYYYSQLFGTDFYSEVARAASRFERPRILSIGCGYGGHDLMIARKLRRPYEVLAIDLNPALFREAQQRAASEGLDVQFTSLDLNFLDLEPGSFDVIYAIASIHHVLNLEHLFATLHSGLSPDGRLVMLDIIGQRQVLFWRENVEFAAEVVRKMPRRYWPANLPWWRRWPSLDPYAVLPRYEPPSTQVGMEGIRQEEIESLMGRWFQAEQAFRYNSFMRLICTNPHLGVRLDPEVDEDRRYLEELIELDFRMVQTGRLRATELFGTFTRRPEVAAS